MTSKLLFKNNCKVLPVMISSWKDRSDGISEYSQTEIPPNTEIEVRSSVGEWVIGSLFRNKEAIELWESHHLDFTSSLAKFRSNPCVIGNYTWNFSDNRFHLEYKEGVVTWSYIE
jgi:hypothetical protein